MKKNFLITVLPLFVLVLSSLKTGKGGGNSGPGEFFDAAVSGQKEAAIGCGPAPAGEAIGTDADGRYAPVFPGWGHYHYRIATENDSAQFYFDQGLSLYYGYHLTESLASFKEAAQKDSGSMMAYWGQALAMGPYYNSIYNYKMPSGVLPVLERMNRLSEHASVKEKDLAGVMNRRYSADLSDSQRTALDRAYSKGMKELIGRYPDDRDIKALYIDGVMTEHSWDLWDNAGVARPWTPELIKYCGEILTADPYHPAALHYHIHLLEASLHPEAMLASAEKLKDLMPGVAHMVHMASHAYQRTGNYARGVFINDAANGLQRNYDSLARQLHLGHDVIHFEAVKAFCGMNGAMYKKAMEGADRCVDIVNASASNSHAVPRVTLQYLYMMPVFTQVRMGKWQEILDRQVPDRSWVYASLLSDFARGMAFVRMGNKEAAQGCLDSLRVKLKDPVLLVRRPPNNAPVKGATVAEGILEGEIMASRGRTDDAMAAFDRAIACEDGMSYGEPKDWPLPARHFAGAWLKKKGRMEQAERLYREDLAQNPGNGWSLLGMAQCLEARHEKGAVEASSASEYRAKAKEAFASAEVMPAGSAY